MTTEKIVTVKTLENEIYGGKLSGKTYESNIVLHDNYGNAVEVTAGFKIASDSGENVEEGVVIEDVSAKDSNSKGNQFVWIPIGKTRKIYTLRRWNPKYGTISRWLWTPTTIESYYQELTSSKYGEASAKNLEEFITKTKEAGGYYIGRYEAGKVNGNTNAFNVKKGQKVYNNITQPEAANLARNLYSNSSFESGLINSYASCVRRGAYYSIDYVYTKTRSSSGVNDTSDEFSFRPILYVK